MKIIWEKCIHIGNRGVIGGVGWRSMAATRTTARPLMPVLALVSLVSLVPLVPKNKRPERRKGRKRRKWSRGHHLFVRPCKALGSINADWYPSSLRPSRLSCPYRLKITRDPRDGRDEREVANNPEHREQSWTSWTKWTSWTWWTPCSHVHLFTCSFREREVSHGASRNLTQYVKIFIKTLDNGV